MAGKKPARKAVQPRGNLEANRKRHVALCAVCNHSEKAEIEAGFLAFQSAPHLAEEFGVSDDAIYRHASFFGLDLKRAENTQKLLLQVAVRGFADDRSISPQVALGAIQELHKITGKHKEPAKNPNDLAKQAVVDIMRETGLSEERARAIVAKQFGIEETLLISQAVN